MDENRSSKFRQDKIGPAGKIAAVQAESVSGGVQDGTYSYLRPAVLALDSPHVAASMKRREPIHCYTVSGIRGTDAANWRYASMS